MLSIKKRFLIISLFTIIVLSLTACNSKIDNIKNSLSTINEQINTTISSDVETISNSVIDIVEGLSSNNSDNNSSSYSEEILFDINSIPDYSGADVIIFNNDEPMFTEEEKKFNGTYIKLSELDELGRCGVATACVGLETEPNNNREDISHVYPSGWNQMQLDNDTWLYNRSHLLMFALTGLNDDNRNLITGTEYFNQQLMLGYESQVKFVVDNYNGHVLYRVTPVFDGDNLVAKGVLMEAYCIEYPEECSFCVFVYNVEPGVQINYETGEGEII